MHPDKKHYKVMVFNHGFGANMIEARFVGWMRGNSGIKNKRISGKSLHFDGLQKLVRFEYHAIR